MPVLSNNVHEIRAYNRLASLARGKILIMLQVGRGPGWVGWLGVRGGWGRVRLCFFWGGAASCEAGAACPPAGWDLHGTRTCMRLHDRPGHARAYVGSAATLCGRMPGSITDVGHCVLPCIGTPGVGGGGGARGAAVCAAGAAAGEGRPTRPARVV